MFLSFRPLLIGIPGLTSQVTLCSETLPTFELEFSHPIPQNSDCLHYYNQYFVLMDSVEDLHCPVCLELSRDAVESDCCGHAFCNDCAHLIQGKQNQCPFCKLTPFVFRQGKLIRRMISAIKVKCPNPKCEQKISNADLQSHSEYCVFTVSKCRVCSEQFANSDLVKHSIQKHGDETLKAVVDYHNNVKSKISNASTKDSKLSASEKPSTILADPLVPVKNKSGKMASLGTTAKYYCGGPLLYKCSCCDGNCGTTNGENCLGCMELDMKSRGLPKGFLVNSDGVICKVDIARKTVYCGTLVSSFRDSRCAPKDPCSSCNKLTKTLPRYQSLCKE